jgi:hypothetical protein
MRRAPRRLMSISLVPLAAVCMAACSTTTSGSSAGTPAAQAPYNYRSLPQRSLRGELVVVAAPEVRVNGKSTRLSAGSRIRNEGNMIVMATTLTNQRFVVNYTLDFAGQVQDVWILSPNERNLAWPRTAEEAQRWEFDTGRQAWTPR